MKLIRKSLSILSVLISIYICYKVSTFTLFDDKAVVIAEINLFPYNLAVYITPSNAVTNSSIQVRRIKNNEEEVLASFDKYDKLDSYDIKNDTLFLKISESDNSIEPFLAKVRL